MGAVALSKSCEIRTVHPSDFAQWKVLWDGYNAFYGRKGETALPEDVSRHTWARFFENANRCMRWLPRSRGSSSGFVITFFTAARMRFSLSVICRICLPRESARGKGVGRALIEEVYQLARAAECSRVYWHTHETNATAMHLYDKVAERSGFVVYRKSLEP